MRMRPDLNIIISNNNKFKILVLLWVLLLTGNYLLLVVTGILGLVKLQSHLLSRIFMYQSVLEFWFQEISPKKWWKMDPAFDRLIAEHFLAHLSISLTTNSYYSVRCCKIYVSVGIHGRPRFAKLSIDDFEKVKIAAIHPDFI